MTANWEPSEQFDEWPGCFSCAHYRHAKCAAYPRAIPLPILAGEIDHLIERPGQVPGVLFEPMDEEHWRRTRERIPLKRPVAVSRSAS